MSNDVRSEEEISQSCMLRLQHAVQALALPADIQLSLFPDFVCKVDELALDFDNWWLCIKGRPTTYTTEQLNALNALDDELTRMSGKLHSFLWTEDALRQDKRWEEVRNLAKRVSSTFGWANEIPPSYAHEYIKGNRINEEG
jgi:hypothetical protein